MRIAVLGPAGVDDMAWNVACGLEDLGHTPILPGSIRGRRGYGTTRKAWAVVREFVPGMERRFVRSVIDVAADLIITVESLPTTVVEMLSNSAPVALWFPDAISNLGSLEMFGAPYVGLFFKEPSLVRRLQDLLELPVHYLPEACNPRIHHIPLSEPPAERNVAVVGNFYPTRMRLLERLHADGIPLRLYGPPLAFNHPLTGLHANEYVRGEAKAKVFRAAAAVLNNLHPAEIEGVNCRLFEAAACGAAVVTEMRSCVPDFLSQVSRWKPSPTTRSYSPFSVVVSTTRPTAA